MRTNYRVSMSLLLATLLISSFALFADGGNATSKNISLNPFDAAGAPCVQNQLHDAGRVDLSVTNWGMIGCFPGTIDQPVDSVTYEPIPSCEFPVGSGNDYLFGAGLWVGARVANDTLTSTGFEGWFDQFEIFPEPCPNGEITRRSSDPASPDFNPDAISDEDLVATYSDTLTDPAYVSYEGGYDHEPIGLQIQQTSLAWSQTSYQDFVIIDFVVTNISNQYLDDVAPGLLVDADIRNPYTQPTGYQDDITGSIDAPFEFAGHTVPIGWAADNDGDPYNGEWADSSKRAVIGVCLLDCSFNPEVSYNWWMPNVECSKDWGPHAGVAAENDTGCSGAPLDDARRWERMLNGERDFDQIWAAQNISGKNTAELDPYWLEDVADGYDTRFLYSIGKVDLAPGDSIRFAFVLCMGENFHSNPNDFVDLFDYQDPDAYYQTLDFTDLLGNIATAKVVYDSVTVGSGTPVVDGTESLPERFAVSQNRPNPFNNATTVEYVVDRPMAVKFEVYNILGERVWSKDVKGVPGRNAVSWNAVNRDGTELPSGVYFYRLVAGEYSTTRKMVLLK